MARKPIVNDQIYDRILSDLLDIGYDIKLIKKVPQIWD